MAQDEVMNLAKAYANAVRRVMDTKGIFLYGSYAKGTAREDSDIDIAVIVDRVPGDYLSTVSKLWGLTRSVGDAIEPVLLTEQDNQSHFIETVYRTGIAI